MSPLREAVLLQMRLRGFAAKTVEAYIYTMKVLCRHCRRPDGNKPPGAFKPHSAGEATAAPFNTFYPLCG